MHGRRAVSLPPPLPEVEGRLPDRTRSTSRLSARRSVASSAGAPSMYVDYAPAGQQKPR